MEDHGSSVARADSGDAKSSVGGSGTSVARVLAAYTPPTSPYPPYINISREASGDVSVTVREPRGPGGECGYTSAWKMTAAEWEGFLGQLIASDVGLAMEAAETAHVLAAAIAKAGERS